MSEPSIPPPPGQPAQKKGLSPVAWILIGCFGVLMLGALAVGACGIFVTKKIGDVAEDFADNPGRAMAEMAVKLNPDLELVETDDDAETVTVRSKESGEEFTLDWSDVENGNFSMSSGEGSVTFDASGGDDGAIVTMSDSEGQKTQIFGAGSSNDIPRWAPVAPGGSEPQGTYSTTDGSATSGAFSYTVSSSVAEVLDFYESTLTDAGYEVSKNTFSSGGRESGMVGGSNDGAGRQLSASVAATDDETKVTVTYSSDG